MPTDTNQITRPTVLMVGQDANAYSILGRCHRAAKKAGWNEDQWSDFKHQAQAGDYDHLLQTVMQHFEVE